MTELEIPHASQVTWFAREPGGTTTYIAPESEDDDTSNELNAP